MPALAADDLQARIDALVGTPGLAVLDPRTQRDCATAPKVDWYGSLHRAVTVTCEGTPGWKLYVPMRGNPQTGPVAAAAAVQMTAPVVVKRGDAVQVAAGGTGFKITASGSAEQDGRVGAHIRVRLSNGTITNAVVESAGNVSLPGYNSDAGGR